MKVRDIAFSIALVLFAFGLASSSESSRSNVMLRNGEVWVRLTHTEGNIHKIAISPSGRYVAANKIVGYFEEHDDTLKPGEKRSMLPKYSVLILDIGADKLLPELTVPRELLHPGKWLENDIYRFTEGSELDIVQEYRYDPKTDQVESLY